MSPETRRRHRRLDKTAPKGDGCGRPPSKRTRHQRSATRVRNLRDRSGMTQAQFAAALGVARVQVSGWENGYHEPSSHTLELMRLVVHDTEIVQEAEEARQARDAARIAREDRIWQEVRDRRTERQKAYDAARQARADEKKQAKEEKQAAHEMAIQSRQDEKDRARDLEILNTWNLGRLCRRTRSLITKKAYKDAWMSRNAQHKQIRLLAGLIGVLPPMRSRANWPDPQARKPDEVRPEDLLEDPD